MKRIYISKSKAGNPDDFMLVRSLLSKFDCDVTEFFGGEYNTNLLDKADILIVVPPCICNINNHVRVGKGQHCEINRFLERSFEAYVVNDIDRNTQEIKFRRIEKSIENAPSNIDKNWVNNFGKLETYYPLPNRIESFMFERGIYTKKSNTYINRYIPSVKLLVDDYYLSEKDLLLLVNIK